MHHRQTTRFPSTPLTIFVFFVTDHTLHYLPHFFFFNDTATTEIYTLSLHDALPILLKDERRGPQLALRVAARQEVLQPVRIAHLQPHALVPEIGHRRQAQIQLLAQALQQRSEEHTSELQSHSDLVCRLLLEKKKKIT